MNQFVDVEQLRSILAPGYSLQDAMDALNTLPSDEDVNVDIFIEPPDPKIHTDEESGNEDDDTCDIRHLSGKELLAPAEIIIGSQRVGDDENLEPSVPVMVPITEPSTSMQYNFPQPSTERLGNDDWVKKRLEVKGQGKFVADWIEGDFLGEQEEPSMKTAQIPIGDYSRFSSLPTDVFEQIFDDTVWELLREETEKYMRLKNVAGCQPITTEELKCFVGILILSGYNTVPANRHYWDQKPDMHNDLVSNAMRRNRFHTILKYLHCADNDADFDQNDKGWKLRKFMNLVKERCLKYFVPRADLNYDESMVKYFGRHPMKQFIKGKPIRFGFKMWCLNSSDGYLINFDLYQGKLQKMDPAHANLFGKAAAPLPILLNELPDDVRFLSYNIFLDNLFCSPSLFCFLREKRYSATGTFRENRMPKAEGAKKTEKSKSKHQESKIVRKTSEVLCSSKRITFPTKSDFQSEKRGSLISAIEKNDGILFAHWKDNGVVTVGSTLFGVKPTVPVKRYSPEQKKNITVQMPCLIYRYNRGMGGTDLMDQNINGYRIGIRNKKWWWPLFSWNIDAMIQNYWILYKKTNKISQLNFRRSIAETYLTRYAVARRNPGPSGRYISSSRVLNDIRFDHLDHYVIYTPEKSRKRCAGINCKSQTRTMCSKCKVGLCVDCFAIFHTKM